MARGGRRAAAEKSTASIKQLQQLQIQFNPGGEIKAGLSQKDFKISDCSDNWDDYGRGSILRIRLINFQKYSDCIIRPGAYMNMLIGPNGTGKSTVVAAIALGLGASPAVMGRSKNVAEFIKYNTGMATIEIVLKCEDPKDKSASGGGKPFVVIKRILRRVEADEQQSDWFINGNVSNQKHVVQCAQDLGVQINNLCQFLPQDRVSEFAQMTPEQMLVATMQAAAPEETLNQFTELVSLKKEEKKLSESLKNDEAALADDQKTLKNLQSMQQRFKEREERRKKIELLKRKRPWALYHQARNKYNELKIVRDRLRSELEAATLETDQGLYNEIKALEGNLKISAKRVKQMSLRVHRARQEAEKVFSEVATAAAIIKDRKNGILERRKLIQKTQEKYEKDRQELRQTDEQISRLKQEMESSNEMSVSVEAADREIKRLSREMGDIEANLADLSNQKDQIISRGKQLREIDERTQFRIGEVKNLRNRRIEALGQMNKNTAKVLNWLKENPEHFQGRIMGPIALDIQVKDEKMAQAIESVISRSVLSSFYCTRVEDLDEFNRIFEEKKWNVNIILLNKYQPGIAIPQCPWSKAELRSLGFDCVVSDLIEAPEMVMWSLHDHSKIHLIPVCLSDDDAIDVIGCERLRNLMKFLSMESFFEIKRSRYNERDVAMKSSPLKKGFILSSDSGVNDSELPRLQEKLASTRAEMQKEQDNMRAILVEIDSANEQISGFKERIQEVQELKSAAVIKLAELKKAELASGRLRKSIRDALSFLQNETDETEDLTELTGLIQRRAQLLVQLRDKFQGLREAIEICGIEEMSHRLDALQLKRLQGQLEQLRSVNENLRRRVQFAEEELSRAKDKAQELLNSADISEIDAEMRKALMALSDDIEVIDRQILEEESLFNAGGSGIGFGPTDLEQLERRACSVQDLEQRINVTRKEIEILTSKMVEMGTLWRQDIDKMIGVISGKFETFFAKIGCAGKITLGVPTQDSSDFSAYTLNIWVKFRETEELQRLTGQRQSGGEKSVSTILYLLSLQELSRAPFRVVDEINQGMDVNNERRIHALIVDTATATQGKHAQYFLITPKLLTGLEYHEKMHILCIFNGPGVLGN